MALHVAHVALPLHDYDACLNLWNLKHRLGFGMHDRSVIFRYRASSERERILTPKVVQHVWLGFVSRFVLIVILWTSITFYSGNPSRSYSSLKFRKSSEITPLLVFTDRCAEIVTLMSPMLVRLDSFCDCSSFVTSRRTSPLVILEAL